MLSSSKIEPATQPPRVIYMCDRANWDALREELHILLTTDYAKPHEGMDAEYLWSKFKHSIGQLVDS